MTLSFFVTFSGPAERSSDGLDEFFHALDKDGDGYVAVEDLATRMMASGKIPDGANPEGNMIKALNTS